MGKVTNSSWVAWTLLVLLPKVLLLENPSTLVKLEWLFILSTGEINEGIPISQMRWHRETWQLSWRIYHTSVTLLRWLAFSICPALCSALSAPDLHKGLDTECYLCMDYTSSFSTPKWKAVLGRWKQTWPASKTTPLSMSWNLKELQVCTDHSSVATGFCLQDRKLNEWECQV